MRRPQTCCSTSHAAQPLLESTERSRACKNLHPSLINSVYKHFMGEGSAVAYSERMKVIQDHFGAEASHVQADERIKPIQNEIGAESMVVAGGECGIVVSYDAANNITPINERPTAAMLDAQLDTSTSEGSAALSEKLDMLINWDKDSPKLQKNPYFKPEWTLHDGAKAAELLPLQKREREAILYIGFLFASYHPVYCE
ncbi:hypothetical protein CYMTET_16428 [Cymbomonas tetramitiformis]|uniref:Uncharacterized protein n=1 Tax=Cymbomonas tetramitiformis TaxID=36881 RepID=A0AAE0GCF3_9CHLO|nr:hypothetical protein CYMTET_16428 [Cymbomonas tetramitiformis]